MNYFDLEDYDRLKDINTNKIINLSQWIWKNDLSRTKIENWSDNFIGTVDEDELHERLNSLFLLKQFMFFGQREFREMLKASYHNLFFKPNVYRIRRENKSIEKNEINEEMKKILRKTRFLGIGNISESSSLLLYYFRQVNNLSSKLFWNVHEIFKYQESQVSTLKLNSDNEKIENYIFLDDISGTGTQAYNFFTGRDKSGKVVNLEVIKQIKQKNPQANIYYITLFSTISSQEKLKELNNLKLKTVFLLDETYKAFNTNSRYFTPIKKDSADERTYHELKEIRLNEINYAKSISEVYFPLMELESYYKFGFKQSQLLIGFFYNIPNNSLPIFWAEENWKNIFRRFEKVLED